MSATSPAASGLEGRLGFVLSVPDSWYELDLDPRTRRDSIRRLVDDRLRGNDQLWPHRRAMAQVLEEQARSAHESGALYCASFSVPTEDGPITGSVTVTLQHDPDPGDSHSGVVDIASRFTETPRGDDPMAPFQVTSVVDVPGSGACPRSSGIDDAHLGEGHFVRHVFMVTAVPVRDLGRVFLVSASSPVLPLADSLLDLFDAVSGTFRVVRPDEEDQTA